MHWSNCPFFRSRQGRARASGFFPEATQCVKTPAAQGDGLPSLKNKSGTSHKKSENIDSHAYMHKHRHKHKHTLWPLCSNPTISWA